MKTSNSVRFLSVKQFADIYNLHPNTILNYIKKGMPHIALRRGYRIEENKALSWLQTHFSPPQENL